MAAERSAEPRAPYDLFPAWSPEGDQIVFHSGRAQEFRDTGQTGIVAQWEAYTIDAVKGEGPGGDIRRLTNRAGNDERCDWQALARPVVQPPPDVGPPAGGGTLSPPPPPVRLDTTPPTVTVSGVSSSMSINAFLKGVTARVTRNEASSIDATLEGSAKKATLAAAFNLSLASRSVARGTGVSSIRLKPSKKLVGRAKKLRARVRVVVTDAAGNRRTVTTSIKVKR